MARQRQAKRPVRIIVLKARQLGISTITEALMFSYSFAWPRSNSLIITHETDASQHILNMTKLYWETYPFRELFTEKYNSKRELEWLETGSTIRIATAAKLGSVGRSRTINFLHASEVAFWPDPATTMLGLRQTIPEAPGTMIILESTANGVGNWFHTMWQDAVDGENDYVPMFFPWWQHPEYTASFVGLNVELDLLSAEERFLRDKLGVDDDHLRWRRWAIANLADGDVDAFHQEYPATPDEAFITSGSNAFDLDKLRECYEPMAGARGAIVPNERSARMEFMRNPRGPLTIFRLPSADRDYGQYFVAGDPAHEGGYDYAVAQVINRRTWEQVAVWRGKIDPITFGDELVKLARFYNDAELTTEVEGPGYATVARLVSLDYPNLWRHEWADRVPGKPSQMFGWSTNWKRKDWAVSELHKLILDHSLTIHDKTTYEEMRAFTLLDGPMGGWGPADKSGHDDCVMSLAIAVTCARTVGPLMPFEDPDYRNEMEPVPAWVDWG